MVTSPATAECPPLPSGPLELDILFSSLAKGKTAEAAIELATRSNPTPEQVTDEAQEPKEQIAAQVVTSVFTTSHKE